MKSDADTAIGGGVPAAHDQRTYPREPAPEPQSFPVFHGPEDHVITDELTARYRDDGE